MFFLRLVLFFLKKVDMLIFVKMLSFERYFRFHSLIGFPIIRLSFYCENYYWPDLLNPRTFNEKLIVSKLKSRNALLPIIADKYTVRSYVAERVGQQILVPLKACYESVDELNFDELGDSFIVKASHASGFNLIVKDNDFDKDQARQTIANWMKGKYRFQPLVWFAQNMQRRIIVEELLLDESGDVPKDYKLFVFNGKVEFIQVDMDRFKGHRRTLYTSEWKRLDIKYKYPIGGDVDKPKNLDEMKDIALKLAADFSFMRVDLYSLNDRIYFGELTPYPSAGYARFSPDDFDSYLGSLFDI